MYDQDIDIFEESKKRSLTAFLEAVLGAESYKAGSQVRMDACPHCGHSNKGSGKLRVKNDITWNCFQCGQGGTIIDAAMYARGLSTPLEAAKEVMGGDTSPAISPAQRQRQVEEDDIRRQWQVWVIKRIHEATREVFNKSAWNYLTQVRGLSPEVVTQAWRRGTLAGVPSDRDEATLWLRSVVGEDELRYAGLWKDGMPSPWIAGRPVIQFVDNHEYAEFRIAYKPTNPKTKKSLGVGKPGVPYFWPGKDPKRCLVVEGCMEQLAALSMGYSGSVLAMAGTGTWHLSWFKALSNKGVQVFDLALNNDHKVDEQGVIENAGGDAQKEIAKELCSAGLQFTDASPKEVGDINDALLRRRKN